MEDTELGRFARTERNADLHTCVQHPHRPPALARPLHLPPGKVCGEGRGRVGGRRRVGEGEGRERGGRERGVEGRERVGARGGKRERDGGKGENRGRGGGRESGIEGRERGRRERGRREREGWREGRE